MTRNSTANRRQFLQTAGTGAAAALAGAVITGSPAPLQAAAPTSSKKDRPFKLAMASYSLRKFSLEDALKITKRVGLDAICLKSFHLPLDLSEEAIKAEAAKVKEAGILLYGGGVISMQKAQDVQTAFKYAKAAGMTKIVGVPAPELLTLVNNKVKEYDIAVCIHNHGPGDKHYATPDIAYEKIKHLDPRIGLCHDVGHTVRVDKDPAALSEQCADRLLDVHIKDVTANTKAGHSIACGRGVIDLPKLLKTFQKIGYKGFLSFEYEEESNDPTAGLAESVGYINGVMDMM